MNTFGGSIGGPILKNKLVLFYNYEGQHLATNGTVSAVTPIGHILRRSGWLLCSRWLSGHADFGADRSVGRRAARQCSAPGVDQAMLELLVSQNQLPLCWPAATVSTTDVQLQFTGAKRLNTNIGKIDFNPNAKNHFFVRGNLQKDVASDVQNLPGQPAPKLLEDNTKGIAARLHLVTHANLVNDLRYGYIRQGYASAGVGKGDYVVIRFLNQPTAQTRSSIVNVPVNTIDDTLSWSMSTHTISVGGNWRLIQNNTRNNTGSFNGASTNPSYLSAKNCP